MMFKKIRFVTDSTCDIPPELLEKHQIEVIPCFINHSNQSFADDGVQLVRSEYYKLLATGALKPHPTTAAPPPALAEPFIQRAFDAADHVVIVTVASKLSGVNNALRLAASSLPQDRITLIDSQTATMGVGWQVLLGAEVAEKTGDPAQVKAAIERVRDHQRVYAALSTLEFLRRSGRVGWAAAGVGSLLQIKPILDVREGEAKSYARVRTFSKAVDELIDAVHKQGKLEKLAVLHTDYLDGAVELKERLKDIAPPDTFIMDITPTIGTHIGPQALGVATVTTAWRG